MAKKRTASRFFRWMKSDLPDCDPSPVLLLGVTKIDSPRTPVKQRPHTVIVDPELRKIRQNNNLHKRNSLAIFYTEDKEFNIEKDNNNKNISGDHDNYKDTVTLEKNTKIETDCYSFAEIALPAIWNKSQLYEIKNRFENNLKEEDRTNVKEKHCFSNFYTKASNQIGNNKKRYLTKDLVEEREKFVKIGQTSPKFCRKRDSVRNISTIIDKTTTATKVTVEITTNDPNANNKTDSTIQNYNNIETPKKAFNEKKIYLTNAELKLKIPKAFITRIRSSSNNKKIECSLFDDKKQLQKKTQISGGENKTTSNTNNNNNNNCRIYDFIPKCTKSNDSESLSENKVNKTKNNLKYKKIDNKIKKDCNIMDRSMDSIGSCSLDVDADSTDFSDTSGSLNLVTPSSGKDFPREFTSRIQERCQIPPPTIIHPLSPGQQTTTILDPNSGRVTTILSSLNEEENFVKKPSYLNLACCVNGYSNLTTYDSKLRQNINRSREVSPIRPITQYTLQYNRNQDCAGYLVVPISVPITINNIEYINSNMMENNHRTTFMSSEKRIFTAQMLQQQEGKDMTDNVASTKFHKTITATKSSSITSTTGGAITKSIIDETPTKSFIQQRVERLYGPDALAQGFFTNKRVTSLTDGINGNHCVTNDGNGILSEKYINSQGIKTNNIYLTQLKTEVNSDANKTIEMNNIENLENLKKLEQSLPVFRHLRPEFRAQLPISPKKCHNNLISDINSVKNNKTSIVIPTSITTQIPTKQEMTENENCINNDDESTNLVSIKNISLNGTEIQQHDSNSISHMNGVKAETSTSNNINLNDDKMIINNQNVFATNGTKLSTSVSSSINDDNIGDYDYCSNEKDGNYFLIILKRERDRLIGLASKTEDDMKELIGADVSEEIIGYLRSASGKARLLATQKIKQFEGLCHHNLNPIPGEKFPTTNQDLQGFWDMVMLQVVNVDSLFSELDVLKANNWKSLVVDKPQPPQGAKLIKRPISIKSTSAGTTKVKAQNGITSKTSNSSTSIAAQKREAQRKQLAELKRKNKLQQQKLCDGDEETSSLKQNGVEFFIPDINSS